ncbi:MAG: hypothetical protein FWC45_09265, partial [Treponema sp.]|nr:hypothetical protein [Treponema sp.]
GVGSGEWGVGNRDWGLGSRERGLGTGDWGEDGGNNASAIAPAGKLEVFRRAREAFCLESFGSGELALAGLCMMPALLFNPDTDTRVVQCLFFWALAWLSGKRNNPLITVSVMLGIVFFNLLVPYGEVLFSLGPLRITSGALQGGIRRAVTLEGLFMLSRCCVRQDLSFPGAFGKILGDSFRVFSRLAEGKKIINRKNWIQGLDGLLFSLSGGEDGETAGAAETIVYTDEKKEPGKAGTVSDPSRLPGRTGGQRTAGPQIILLAAVILAWLPLLLHLIKA